MLLERGLEVDHSTVNRWVLAYAPLIERRLRPFRKPHCGSVRVDETYVRIRGEWRYLYRAIDKHGEAVDFLLTAKRNLDAARRFFRKMLKESPLLSPDRIGTDGASTFPGATAISREEGTVRTKGALSPTTAKLMVFKLVMAAAKTWRRLKGENLLPKVVAGVTFKDGTEVIDIPADRAA